MEKKKEKYLFETRVNGDYGCIVCRSKKEALKYFEAEETGTDPGDYKAIYKTVCFYDGSWNPVYPLSDFNALVWLERSESGQVEKIA